MSALQIKDWEKVFENHECRKLKKLSWIAMPMSWDGLGFARLRKHKNAISIFAGWCLIVQIAAKMPQRGLLVNADGLALGAEDMADMTGFPVEIFAQALDALSGPQIGWIERIGNAETGRSLPAEPGESPDNLPESPGIARNFGGVSRNLPASPDAPGETGGTGEAYENEANPDNLPESPGIARNFGGVSRHRPKFRVYITRQYKTEYKNPL